MTQFQNALGELITFLSWLAPTQNVDGTDIDYSLSYRLYVDSLPVMTFPGTLNPDGRYQFALADVPALGSEGVYELKLTAFPEGTDLDIKPELESDPSNAISITTIVVIIPKGPSDLRGD